MIYDRKALSNALMFDYAYTIIYEQFQKGVKEFELKDVGLLVPLAVNCAFSCEMFLKAMLPSGTRGHKLNNELFKRLDSEIAANIRMRVIEIMRMRSVAYSEEDFEIDLTKNEKAFEQWRYFHEDRETITFNVEFMNSFQKCLKEIASIEDKQ